MILELIPASDDVETEGLDSCGIVRKEGLSFPVRALVLIIDNLVLIPTFEFHSDW
jgi:hypothetical protein